MSDAVFFDIIDAQLAAAGALGGLVHAFRANNATPREVSSFLIVGALAGNFITPVFLIFGGMAMNFFSPRLLEIVSVLPPVSLAFGIGMAGKPLCFAFEMALTSFLGKAKNE
jgi:hypothetical protein